MIDFISLPLLQQKSPASAGLFGKLQLDFIHSYFLHLHVSPDGHRVL